jgi:hypothetical protein
MKPRDLHMAHMHCSTGHTPHTIGMFSLCRIRSPFAERVASQHWALKRVQVMNLTR